MKKKILTILILTAVLLTAFCANSFAQEVITGYRWHDKLARGAINVVTSPVEIVRGIDLTSKEQGALTGWTLGLIKGMAGTVLRLGTGLIDVVTFPAKFPNKARAPIIDPEYVWEDWRGEYMR